MKTIEWTFTNTFRGVWIIYFWSAQPNKTYLYNVVERKSMSKIKDPKRLFIRKGKFPYYAFNLISGCGKEFFVTEEEFNKGFPGWLTKS